MFSDRYKIVRITMRVDNRVGSIPHGSRIAKNEYFA